MNRITSASWFSRCLPFGIYILFIPLQDVIGRLFFPSHDAAFLTPAIYAVKIILVVAALAYFYKSYDELYFKKINVFYLIISLVAGLCAFVLWINLPWDFARMGEPHIFNPYVLPQYFFYGFIVIRFIGTAIVVPIFEELFWRSFILRYIINPDFTSVKIGAFTWPSFVISAVLFGLEHHYWLAGVLTGMIYNALLYKTRNLWYCIIAHGVTNLVLGVYVLNTGSWQYW